MALTKREADKFKKTIKVWMDDIETEVRETKEALCEIIDEMVHSVEPRRRKK